MPDTISLTGVVATNPRHITTTEGLDITSFRLASSQRRFDRHQNAWVDMGTNWYTITAFRHLASNLATSVSKGDRVVASGRLRIREWENAEKSGTTVEIEVDAVGHDLGWGTTQFSKSLHSEAQGGGSSVSTPGREQVSGGAEGLRVDTGPVGWAVPGGSSDALSTHRGGDSERVPALDSDGFLPTSTVDTDDDAHTPHLDSVRL